MHKTQWHQRQSQWPRTQQVMLQATRHVVCGVVRVVLQTTRGSKANRIRTELAIASSLTDCATPVFSAFYLTADFAHPWLGAQRLICH